MIRRYLINNESEKKNINYLISQSLNYHKIIPGDLS